MKGLVLGLVIIVVVVWFFRQFARPRPLTEQEKDFVDFIHAQARERNLVTKEDVYGFVVDQFDQLSAWYAMTGILLLNDVPRIKRVIVETYKPAA